MRDNTDYLEDELWKTETIENEAREVLHHIHVSINKARGSRLEFPQVVSVSSSIDEKTT